jgi:hypothetical protein
VGVDDYLVQHSGDAFNMLADEAVLLTEEVIGVSVVISGGKGDVYQPPALDEAALYGPLGDFIRQVEPYTEASPAAILGSLLAMLGVEIGNAYYVTPGGRKEPLRINVALVGPTSHGRKGTANHIAERGMEALDTDWSLLRVSGLSTGEGLIAKLNERHPEKRSFVIEEEFGRLLAVMRREGSILSQVIRQCYDSGGNLEVTTRNSPLKVQGAHVGLCVHVTVAELLNKLNRVDVADGFANRFLWLLVRKSKKLYESNPIPDGVFAEFGRKLIHIADADRNNPQRIPLADAAKGRWCELYDYLDIAQATPLVQEVLARGESLIFRLAGVYSLLDTPQDGVSPVIEVRHLDAAMAVWRYCEESVNTIFRTTTGTHLGDKIMQLLATGAMTQDAFRKHLSNEHKQELGNTLRELEAAGKIRRTVRQPGPRGGRPVQMWEKVS